jgi:NADPH:quinone reductase-like Zn-dependent oxidoreductase
VAGDGSTGVMQAVRLHPDGGARRLAVEQVARPRPGPGEALVRVHAAAITRDELEWPLDRLPAIPSYEMSGVVHEVAADVRGLAPGDEVYALTSFDRDGAACEYMAVQTSLLAARPASLSHVETAAVPMPALSAWQGLFDHGRLEAGERVLILGAVGGVGHAATQLARWRGAYVIGVSSHGDLELVRELGADEAVAHDERFDEMLEAVDLVFDTAGGDALARSAALVRPGGRIVSVAEEPPAPQPEHVAAVYFVVEPSGEQLTGLTRLLDEGRLRPAVDAVFALADAPAAFARVQERGKRGKVVLEIQ